MFMKMLVELTKQSVRTQTNPFSTKKDIRFAAKITNNLCVKSVIELKKLSLKRWT